MVGSSLNDVNAFSGRTLYYEQLKQEIIAAGQNAVINGYRIFGRVLLTPSELKGVESLTFWYCRFEGEVVFDKSVATKEITFKGCWFREGVSFRYCHLHSTEEKASMHFEKCTARQIEFHHCIAYKDIHLENVLIENEFEMNDCIFPRKASIGVKHLECKGGFTIKESRRMDAIEIEDATVGRMNVQAEYKRRVYLDNVISEGEMELELTAEKGLASLTGVKASEEFRLIVNSGKINIDLFSCKFDKTAVAVMTKSDAQSVAGMPYPEIGRMRLNQTAASEGFMLIAQGGPVEDVSIYLNPEIKNLFLFKRALIGKFFTDGENAGSSLQFDGCDFAESFTIVNWKNNGNLVLNKCQKEFRVGSRFNVTDTILGKTLIANTALENFEEFRLEGSHLTELTTSGVTWFKPTQLKTDDPTPQGLVQRREVFRQLKQMSDKQGDRIQALAFQAEEMRTYRAFLKTGGKRKRGDKFILFVGWTNDYGQNWLRPLGIILGLTVLLFPFTVMAAKGSVIDLSFRGVKYFVSGAIDHLGVFWQMFNPARAVRWMFPAETYPDPSHWLYFLDGLQRVLLALFIFQIVSAFRKYVKG